MKARVFCTLPFVFLLGGCHLFSPAEKTPAAPGAATVAEVRVAAGDDFFAYANGAWLRAHPLPEDRAEYSVSHEVADRVEADVKAIDAALANSAAPDVDARKLIDFMRAAKLAETREFALPPTLRDAFAKLDAAETPAQILLVAAALHPSGVDAFHGFGAGQDVKNSDRVVPYFWQGGLSLPERDYYRNGGEAGKAARDAFPRYVATMLRHAGCDAEAAAKAGVAVLAFETKLAGISSPMEELRVVEKNYFPMTPDALRTLAPGLPWDGLAAAYGLPKDGVVIVSQPGFLKGLDALLATTSPETLKAYVRFRALDTAAPYINRQSSEEAFAFHGRVLTGVPTQRPAETRAILARDRALGELVGKRYVAAHFPAPLRARYRAMCEIFRTVLSERFAANAWMDAPTRARAREKLALMKFKVGYTDAWTDYSSLPVSVDDQAENMLAAARFGFSRDMSRLGKSPDRERWAMNPHTCNAYFDPSNNELVFPAASFVIPGVDPMTMDDAMAYGFIGATIGHEMTHAFDDEGRKFDGKGDLADWWTKESVAAFEAQVKPIVERYSAEQPVPGTPINGAATLGENIADLGGLAIALDAFKRTECYKSGRTVGGETPIRRFFLAYAYSWAWTMRPEMMRQRLLSDVHSPAKARVNLVVPNFPEFHEAFGVKPGDRLWLAPELRSTVW